MATKTETIHRLFKLLFAILMLPGCAELPVPVRAPYSAAPLSYSAAWRPPPALAVNPSQIVAGPPLAAPIDPSSVYGLADLIDFVHRSNPETPRLWGKDRAAASRVGRAAAAY